MSKKRLIRNRPNQGDLGIYTFKDDNLNTDYIDSDSLPLRYDKFEGKDEHWETAVYNIHKFKEFLPK